MKAVYKGGEGEIIEKKSRFIATVSPAESEEEAVTFIAAVRKKYWDARHNCYAFVTGPNQELSRCSDDGEPAQTAGRPMLDVLLREGIHNAAVVVTRYFGGVLLGTGGLVRAYQKAVQEGLLHSVIIDKQRGRKLTVETDYTGLGKLQYVLAQQQGPEYGLYRYRPDGSHGNRRGRKADRAGAHGRGGGKRPPYMGRRYGICNDRGEGNGILNQFFCIFKKILFYC